LQETSRTLKLEDYEEITFDPNVDDNREKREATSDENVNNRGLRADDDDDIVSTTTVESSTIPVMKPEDQESSENSFVTMSPPSSQQDFYHSPPMSHNHYPYPLSSNPSAQYVSITNQPHPYLPPVQNYYDFYPSQLDYHHHGYTMPYCNSINSINPINPVNPIHHKFTPLWSNYRKWK
jgi:hypothetical protein